MARFEPDANVTLSLLDRLIDNDLRAKADTPMTRNQSVRQLRASLKRDLEWLLNSRRIPDEAGESTPELQRSLFNYGLPDFSNLSVRSVEDQNRLLWLMETAVAYFEPRLRGVRVTLDPVPTNTRLLRFQIQALLMIDPAPERVSFDTVLELNSGEYQVRGE
jgi:type VI secretion system protein ImpF